MSDQMIVGIITFIGGLIGGSGIVGGLVFYRLRKKEISFQSKIESLSEKKIEVYKKCTAFLRRLKSYRMYEAFEIWNELADELVLWGSDNVYHVASQFFLKLANDPSLHGMDWETEIAPIIKAMIEDINPGTTLRSEDLLPYAKIDLQDTFILDLKQLALSAPKEFREIAKNLKENTALIEEILKFHMGDPLEVTRAIKNEIDMKRITKSDESA